MTAEQVVEVRSYLINRGLTLESLQSELLDHICCDVEIWMEQGLPFQAALEKVTSEMPKSHFKKIQLETMEAVSTKTKPTTILAYLAFTLLIMATSFQLLRLPGGWWILLSSFGLMAITLFTGLLMNPRIREKERGRSPITVLVVFIIMFLVSLSFQILRLPGMALLRQVSVLGIIALLSGYAIYAYLKPEKVMNHIALDYVKREGFGIEKALIALLFVGVAIMFKRNDLLSVVFFMLVFSLGSVYYFINTWQYYGKVNVKKNWRLSVLIVSIFTFALYLLPTIRLFDVIPGTAMIWSTYSIVSMLIGLHYFLQSSDKQKWLMGFFSVLISLMSGLNLEAKVGIFNYGEGILNLLYSPAVFIFLLTVLIVFFKRPAFRGLLIMTIGMWFFSSQMVGI